ncbi:hypothetical protein DEO72_LG7g1727 [Vigna unguiculata]|uniref:Uncharacterized protein n=1 Tax=Vigna unguiculata TaxID=3917 RepID=A0A4D6MKA8_VIGUN|nr:hypothetical protein DEO72_LG7g1727 [Vigna unguiculata]
MVSAARKFSNKAAALRFLLCSRLQVSRWYAGSWWQQCEGFAVQVHSDSGSRYWWCVTDGGVSIAGAGSNRCAMEKVVSMVVGVSAL